jgi:hypothetical protein
MALVLSLLIAVPAYADRSAEKTGDAAIVSGAGCFAGIVIQTDGANSVTVSIYDNASAASGNDLIAEWVVTSNSDTRYHALGFEISPCLNRSYNGIYVDITTSGAVKYMVYYMPGR